MFLLTYRRTRGDHARSEVYWHCTDTYCDGKYIITSDLCYGGRLSAWTVCRWKSGDDVDIYGLYTERKKEVGKSRVDF